MSQDKEIRIILVRHGEPIQHRGKIFLGQTDIALSEKGIEEAKSAGQKLLEMDVIAEYIYTSDLLRAFETANIISEALGDTPVIKDKLFREMNMGSWDGEFIEEIKTKFPEEYLKRGEDIINYRMPGGENFYDLKGRVTREMWRLLTGDFAESYAKGKSKDFVLVAHLGVMKSIVAELSLESEEAVWGDFYHTGSIKVLKAPEWMVIK